MAPHARRAATAPRLSPAVAIYHAAHKTTTSAPAPRHAHHNCGIPPSTSMTSSPWTRLPFCVPACTMTVWRDAARRHMPPGPQPSQLPPPYTACGRYRIPHASAWIGKRACCLPACLTAVRCDACACRCAAASDGTASRHTLPATSRRRRRLPYRTCLPLTRTTAFLRFPLLFAGACRHRHTAFLTLRGPCRADCLPARTAASKTAQRDLALELRHFAASPIFNTVTTALALLPALRRRSPQNILHCTVAMR